MSNELKPCPKCATSKHASFWWRNEGVFRRSGIACECGHSTELGLSGYGITLDELECDATKDWNTRPIEDALRAELVGALQDVIADMKEQGFLTADTDMKISKALAKHVEDANDDTE